MFPFDFKVSDRKRDSIGHFRFPDSSCIVARRLGAAGGIRCVDLIHG